MSKKQKKRNKKYNGANSKIESPSPVRVRAVKRSIAGQWWHDNKKKAKIFLGIFIVIAVIIWCIVSLFSISY